MITDLTDDDLYMAWQTWKRYPVFGGCVIRELARRILRSPLLRLETDLFVATLVRVQGGSRSVVKVEVKEE